MYRRIGLAAAAVALAMTAGHGLFPTPPCDGCSTTSPSVDSNLLVGLGLMAMAYFGIAWLEKAPLRSVLTHLSGVAATCAALFYLLR